MLRYFLILFSRRLPIILTLNTQNDLVPILNKTLGRARDPRANGAWLNKLTE